MRNICWKASVLVLVCLPGQFVCGQNAGAEAVDDRAQIEAVVKSYVDAFKARDAEQLASYWTAEGVYTSRTSGEEVVGRDSIKESFSDTFAEDAVPTLNLTTDSIECISPNVALERGVATVTTPEGEVSKSRYSTVYVKRDDRWLIDRVTEEDLPVKASTYEHLKVLEPLIGEWSHLGDDFSVEVACRWAKNQNYISRTYKIVNTDNEEVESSGLQIIGWDAKAKQIHSWLFDSDGGFVSGTWNERDGKWVVSSVATLADGGSGSFTTILQPVDEDKLTWQKINQIVDGQLLPNVDEIIFVRK